MTRYCLAIAIAFAPVSVAVAADMLPLNRGIYVSANVPCESASNVDALGYWGGRKSLNEAQSECMIEKLSKKGNVYTVTDVCKDIATGKRTQGMTEGGPTVLTITDMNHFSMGGQVYRYCGPKM